MSAYLLRHNVCVPCETWCLRTCWDMMSAYLLRHDVCVPGETLFLRAVVAAPWFARRVCRGWERRACRRSWRGGREEVTLKLYTFLFIIWCDNKYQKNIFKYWKYYLNIKTLHYLHNLQINIFIPDKINNSQIDNLLIPIKKWTRHGLSDHIWSLRIVVFLSVNIYAGF